MNQENDTYDYQRYSILFVDDEANSRKYFERLFGRKFRILLAEDGVEALEVFHKHADDIGIIVTDQRMPNETGVGFLSKIADDYPDVIKILSTAYSDIDAAIGSVNQGGIFRYVTKPWDIPELEITLRRAMEFYIIKHERDSLLGAKMLAIGNILSANRLAAFAFVPVCSRLPSANCAEAISSFVRLGISSPEFSPNPISDFSSPDFAKVHATQLKLASLLESSLPSAMEPADIKDRIDNFNAALQNAGANDASYESETATVTLGQDPIPNLLNVILGNEVEEESSQKAAKVLASVMAIYDRGYTVVRERASTSKLIISPRSEASKNKAQDCGSETVKWIIDDELLISTALGML
ncbi:response regulator [Luteolibacter sp. AS25]|uniref:response regulator n=1 Tax=Luteolibacter sp. AS25 TaxID=3135776 RepID=UPI00398AC314